MYNPKSWRVSAHCRSLKLFVNDNDATCKVWGKTTLLPYRVQTYFVDISALAIAINIHNVYNYPCFQILLVTVPWLNPASVQILENVILWITITHYEYVTQ
mgnify:CR=1 FL=1